MKVLPTAVVVGVFAAALLATAAIAKDEIAIKKKPVEAAWSKTEIEGALAGMIKKAKDDNYRRALQALQVHGTDAQRRAFVAGKGPQKLPSNLRSSLPSSVNPDVMQCTRGPCKRWRECSGPNNGPPCHSTVECPEPICEPCRPPAC